MRHSEFWALCSEVFGVDYAPTLARELALDAFDSLSPIQALEAGEQPRDVWHAMCDQMSIPPDERVGADPSRVVPRRRAQN